MGSERNSASTHTTSLPRSPWGRVDPPEQGLGEGGAMPWLHPPAPPAPSQAEAVLSVPQFTLSKCAQDPWERRHGCSPPPPAPAASHCWGPWHSQCHPLHKGWMHTGVHRPVSSLETSTAEPRPTRDMEPQAVKSHLGTRMALKREGEVEEGQQTSGLGCSKGQSQVILHHEMLLSLRRLRFLVCVQPCTSLPALRLLPAWGSRLPGRGRHIARASGADGTRG